MPRVASEDVTDPVLTAVESALVEHFGSRPARASVSFVGVEPIEVLRFEPIPGERAYLSLGMSRHPMTGPEQAVVATDGPRGELMLHLQDPADRFADVWSRVALLAASPAVESVVFRRGLTMDLQEPLVAGSACTGVVVTDSPLPDVTTPAGPVTVFAIVPVTANELAWARARSGDALLERLEASGEDLRDLDRRTVDLG